MLEDLLSYLAKRSITLVQIEIITGHKVVGHVNVVPPVPVDIAYHNAEPHPRIANACFQGNVPKGAVFVPVESIVPNAVAGRIDRANPIGLQIQHRMVEHVRVQVSVSIIVKKDSLCRVARIG